MGGVLCKKHNKTEHLPDIITNQTPSNIIEEKDHEEDIHKDHKDVSINNEELFKNHHEEHLTDEEKAINDIVERYLNNHLVNCKFIPDFIERKMYRNVLKMIMGILEDTIEKTEIRVLGHKINFTITPIVENEKVKEKEKENNQVLNTKNVLTINPNIITTKLNDNQENEIVSNSITTTPI